MAANTSRTRILTESAIMVALATVLSMLKIWESPYGGSITILSMAPIIVLSLRRGVKVGLAAGFAHSLIQLLLGLGDVAWVPTATGIVLCILTDYIIPFTLLGLGGIFRNVKFTKNDSANLVIAAALGALLVTVLRYISHIVSGAVIWYALDLEWYADDPTHIVHRYGAWAFSAIYNGIYMIPEIIATVVGTPLLTKALSKVKQ
ncbi:MAG: energy-coupled thiamine transporter ThiT [Faecousia sp.]